MASANNKLPIRVLCGVGCWKITLFFVSCTGRAPQPPSAVAAAARFPTACAAVAARLPARARGEEGRTHRRALHNCGEQRDPGSRAPLRSALLTLAPLTMQLALLAPTTPPHYTSFVSAHCKQTGPVRRAT